MAERKGPWLQAFSGRKVYPFDPQPEDINIADIAHHLSMEPRFNGACLFPYSVAQHSLLVAQLVAPQHALLGLLHDAPQAYLRCTSKLVKPHLWLKHPDVAIDYEFAEANLMIAITAALKIDTSVAGYNAVTVADRRAMAIETRQLLHQPLCPGWDLCELPAGDLAITLAPLPFSEVKAAFLIRYMELTRGNAPAASMPLQFRDAQPWHY